jgi:nitroimidazol reductase NimA-like FMN-containing flavoprotein (pyridoxamine 5'-phosphate oxidase superfamily)
MENLIQISLKREETIMSRKLSEKEIRDFIEQGTWGTLVGVERDKPYAIENTYANDGKYIYCGSMPGGRMAQCIKKNPNVAYKICTTDKRTRKWKAVIIEGKAERLTKKEDILLPIRLIAKKAGYSEKHLDPIAERMAANPEKSNFIRIPFKVIGGRCST